jgi:hypothetical protein
MVRRWELAAARTVLRHPRASAAIAHQLAATSIADRVAHGLEIRLMSLNGSCATLATKLRLSVQAAVHRHSRMLDERGLSEAAESDPLLGGTVVRLRT